jgi:hypothetical protein
MDPIFHEAENIRDDNALEPEAGEAWIATHRGCGGMLRLLELGWKCDACKVSFRDVHVEDVQHEAQRAAARNEASVHFHADPGKAEKYTQKAYDKINPKHAKVVDGHRKQTRAIAKSLVKRAEKDFATARDIGHARALHAEACARLPLRECEGARVLLDEAHARAYAAFVAQRVDRVRAMLDAGESAPDAPSVYELFVAGHSEDEARDLATEAAAVRDEYDRQLAERIARALTPETPEPVADAIAEEAPADPASAAPIEIEDPRVVEQRAEFVKYLLDNDKPEPNVPTITEVTAAGHDIHQAEQVVREQERFRDEYRRQKAQRETEALAKKPGSL